jgi:energy-coupling factor transporter ATP-binding protein EcfA2
MSGGSARPSPGLLVVLTGPPGAGKTRLLAALAAWHGTTHGRTEGFVAVAGERAAPGAGADEYRLQLLATGEELTWARRDETLSPPYRFEPATRDRLGRWAGSLAEACPLVVLDEFSRFEARGEGLMPLWPAIVAARPRIVVLAVRAGLEDAIEARIGRRFDLRIDAARADALAQLQGACADFGEWTRIGLFGGAAGGVETTVGTALHVAKVPLRGLALASLQATLMTFTGFGLSQPGRLVWVPFISAGLKALSPGGSRLRPMLAIATQGALYGAAVHLAGWNVAGVALGGALVGAWAALQGFALQYLALGGEMLKAYDAVLLWLAARFHVSAPGLGWLVGAWALLHALVAGGGAVAAWRLRAPPKRLRDLIERESRRERAAAGGAAGRLRERRHPLRDLARWPFWLPLAVVAAILLTSGRPLEAVAWLVLRFLAVSVVLLALVSLVRPARWADGLRRRGFWGPALALADAIDRHGGAATEATPATSRAQPERPR